GGADTGAEGEIDGARCQVDSSTESLHRPANRVLPVTRRGNRAIAQNFEMREYDLSTRQRAGARKVRGSLHRDRPVSGSLGGGERAASTTGAEQRIGGCFATNCHTEEREAKGERTQVHVKPPGTAARFCGWHERLQVVCREELRAGMGDCCFFSEQRPLPTLRENNATGSKSYSPHGFLLSSARSRSDRPRFSDRAPDHQMARAASGA